MSSEFTLGGQAVIEGVLMRSKTHYAVAVRSLKGGIVVKREVIHPPSLWLWKLPLFRGIVALYETLSIGFKALIYSASLSSGEDKALSKKELFMAVFLSVVLGVALFIALPFFIASAAFSHGFLFNLFDGFLRLAVLVSYLVFVSFFSDVRRIFQYHGAEHMVIHAFEHKDKLVAEKIRRFPTMHPRCGTSFLLIVVFLSVVVFSLITSESWAVRFFSRILLVPVIAGVSYEVLKFSARHRENAVLKFVSLPGIWLQYITTRQPDDSQIEVAVASLNALENS